MYNFSDISEALREKIQWVSFKICRSWTIRVHEVIMGLLQNYSLFILLTTSLLVNLLYLEIKR